MSAPSCRCVEVEGDEFCPVHDSTDPICDKCGKPAEDGIFVVVCRHVIDGDFDEDDNGEQVPRIRRIEPLPSKPAPTVHTCGDDSCPMTELCSVCWGWV